MQNEVPNSVTLVVGSNDTQLGFFRRILMEAAFKAGLPLLERVDFANFILRLPVNSNEAEKLLDVRMQERPPNFRMLWSGKDPSPKDKTLEIQDSEFNKQRGKDFTIVLNDFEKEELKRRRIYYQLSGGVLGSGKEVPLDSEVIIIDLNLIYQEELFSLTEARNTFGGYVSDAIKVYEPLGIKFYISDWSPGTATFVTRSDGKLEATITKGAKDGFHNVIFGRRAGKTGEERFSLSYTTFDGASKPIASFIYQGALGGGGAFANYELRTHSLAHELGHVFGLLGSPEITDATNRNKDADWDIDKAIIKLLSGEIKKGIHWKRSGLILPDASGKIEYLTVFDKLRAGARAIARKV